VRTILLLVVLMFLAASVAIDDTLVGRPSLGRAYFVGALIFAAVVSEGVLRGVRLRLPAGYRVPYYLILALFFLYPVALSPWINAPASEAMHWGLFAFSPLAGLVFLTLIPAVRKGPRYVANNGSPWRWPLYPWVLFGFLALGVCGRAYYLCMSFHNVHAYQSIFGPYFLIPFLLALDVLLLEAGLVTNSRAVLRTALAVPLGLVMLAAVGHRSDAVYQHFLKMVYVDLGGMPLFLALVAVAGYYLYAFLRKVPKAPELLCTALFALAVVGPATTGRGTLEAPHPLPIFAISVLQLGLWVAQRASWRALVGLGCLATSVTVAVPGWWSLPIGSQEVIAFHVGLAVVLAVGTFCDDLLGRALQTLGAILIMFAGLAAVVGPQRGAAGLPPELVNVYPVVMALFAFGYARLSGHQLFVHAALACLGAWTIARAGQAYAAVKRNVVGLDAIALGLVFFVLAALISLGKAGLLGRWLSKRKKTKLATSSDEIVPPW
jgi:hypothetical protein